MVSIQIADLHKMHGITCHNNICYTLVHVIVRKTSAYIGVSGHVCDSHQDTMGNTSDFCPVFVYYVEIYLAFITILILHR